MRIAAALALVLAASAARAETPAETARARFEKGEVLYNLGKLDDAIVEFDAAYSLDPDPAYLFNLAQAHRLRGHAERALFLYRRYLDLVPDAPNRAEVRERVAALSSELSVNGRTEPPLAAAPASPRRLRLELGVGWSRIYFSGPLADPTYQMGADITLAYIVHRGDLTIDLGLLYGLTSMSYTAASVTREASYAETYALAAADYPIVGRLHASLALGVGATLLGPLAAANGLTTDMGEHDPLLMVGAHAHLTLAVRLDPAVDLVGTLFGFSIARANGELDGQVTSVVRYNPFFLGLRVQL